jgi:HAE1 family hydrophobic/amphiphilic exporter-1
VTTTLVFVALIVLGLFSLRSLPIDLFPDVETNTIMVMTSYAGTSASDIEQNVTRPLENTLNSVEHLKHITSNSRENVSVVTLEFEYGYDIESLTNDVRDKLDMVSSMLPDDANTPIIFKFSSDMIPIVLLSVQADQSMPGLYKILDENVANPLARVDGVGSVSIAGAPKREIHIYLDPLRMEAYNLSVETVAALVGAENRNIPGGTFDIGNETYPLRVQGEFSDPQQMGNMVVGMSPTGGVVHLSDVARIDDSLEERAQESFSNGQKGAMIIVQKQSGANSVQISEKIAKELPKIQKNLPSDIKLGYIVDTSDNIRNTIGSLVETVLFALLFVGIVVFVFLGRWRATVIVLVTIPISLIASFIYLYATGNSLNIVSLSALSIAIGMVVDDAIVVLENVTTHIERGSAPMQAAVNGTNEVALSVMASTLTLIAVFFPLTLVKGMTGVLFKQLGWMVTIMMVLSLICALMLTPMLCSRMLRLNVGDTKIFQKVYGPILKVLNKIDDFYAKVLDKCVAHRWITTATALGVFIASMFLMKFIGTEFFPTNDNSRLGLTLELPIGTRVDIAKDVSERLYKEWTVKYPEIKVFNYRVGQASSDNMFASMQDNGSHIISMNITLVDADKRKRGITEIAAGMRQDLKNYPELKKAMVNVGGGRGGGMSGQNLLNYEIYGYDFAKTDSVAQRLKRILESVPGAADINISRSDYQPEYHVDFDREKLAMYGLNLSTAATALRNRINGTTASYFREDGMEYDIKVMYDPEHRRSISDIENIMLYNAIGTGVRLKEVGTVTEQFYPPTIERKDRERIITVSTVVQDRAMSEVIADAQPLIDKMDKPAEVMIQLSGSYEDQQDSFGDLALLGLLIILLVYMVMAGQFESFTYPGIIMTSILFAFSGIVIILLLTGTNLNIMSMIGAIMLIGIVVKNGIVLIDYINLNRERGMSIRRAVINGGHSRLRPVLMTSLTTILGMVPMAVGTGVGSEMWRPMGTAVIGGLAMSTLMTLLFVPTMYTIFALTGIRRTRKKIRKEHAKS